MSVYEEMLNDFHSLSNEIDAKSYNPFDGRFKAALNVGLMCFLLNSLKNSEEYKYSNVGEEIDGARKYADLYKATKNEEYKEMALDEIKHANILIKEEMGQAIKENDIKALESMRKCAIELETAIKTAR